MSQITKISVDGAVYDLPAGGAGGISSEWISAEDGVLTLLDSTACCVKDALAGDISVLFPAASDSPRSFSLHFLAGDSLAFAWPDGVSFREPFNSGSFESGKGYELSFQEVGDGVFSASRTTTGLASRSLVDLAVYEEKDGKAEKTDDAVAKKSEVGGIVTARQYTDLWDLENGETIRLYFAWNGDRQYFTLSNIEGWDADNGEPTYPLYWASVSDVNITSVTLNHQYDSGDKSSALQATRRSKNALGLACIGDNVSEFANDAGYMKDVPDEIDKTVKFMRGSLVKTEMASIGPEGVEVKSSEGESVAFNAGNSDVTVNVPLFLRSNVDMAGPVVSEGSVSSGDSLRVVRPDNKTDVFKVSVDYGLEVRSYDDNSLCFRVDSGNTDKTDADHCYGSGAVEAHELLTCYSGLTNLGAASIRWNGAPAVFDQLWITDDSAIGGIGSKEEADVYVNCAYGEPKEAVFKCSTTFSGGVTIGDTKLGEAWTEGPESYPGRAYFAGTTKFGGSTDIDGTTLHIAASEVQFDSTAAQFVGVLDSEGLSGERGVRKSGFVVVDDMGAHTDVKYRFVVGAVATDLVLKVRDTALVLTEDRLKTLSSVLDDYEAANKDLEEIA
jgi:hypothetical protein